MCFNETYFVLPHYITREVHLCVLASAQKAARQAD